MKAFSLILGFCLFVSLHSYAAKSPVSKWRAVIHRNDGNDIVFNFEAQQNDNKTTLYVLNANERLRVDSVRFIGDSVFVKMPVFESSFRAKATNGKWAGIWLKGTSSNEQTMPFTAEKSDHRFDMTDGPAKVNVTGRWAVKFEEDSAVEA